MSNLVVALRERYGREFILVEELAVELGVEVEDIMDEINSNNLKNRKIGKKTLISIKEVERVFSENQPNDNQYQESLDQMATATLTCQQEVDDETIIIVECDVNMSKGCVTCVKGANGKNRWMVQIDLGKTPDGKRIRKSKSYKTEKEAREALRMELGVLDIANISLKENSSIQKNMATMTLKEFTNHYFSLGIGRGKSRTQEGYKEQMRIIIKNLGEKTMQELTKDHIRQLFNELKMSYSQPVLNNQWGIFKRIATYAFDEEYIEKDIFKKLEKPISEHVSEEEDYKAFNEKELDKIIDISKEYAGSKYASKKTISLYTIFIVLKSTGMRPSELRGLKWKNFDSEEKTIKVYNAITRKYENSNDIVDKAKYKEILGPTKSKYSKRTLYLSDEAVEALIAWRNQLDTECSEVMRESEFVFPSQEGSFISENALRCKVERFKKKFKLEDTGLHLYKFRHTLCTQLILGGIPVSVIQKIMGDNTQDVIMKIYTHIDTKHVKEASIKFFEEQNRKYREKYKEECKESEEEQVA